MPINLILKVEPPNKLEEPIYSIQMTTFQDNTYKPDFGQYSVYSPSVNKKLEVSWCYQ